MRPSPRFPLQGTPIASPTRDSGNGSARDIRPRRVSIRPLSLVIVALSLAITACPAADWADQVVEVSTRDSAAVQRVRRIALCRVDGRVVLLRQDRRGESQRVIASEELAAFADLLRAADGRTNQSRLELSMRVLYLDGDVVRMRSFGSEHDPALFARFEALHGD